MEYCMVLWDIDGYYWVLGGTGVLRGNGGTMG